MSTATTGVRDPQRIEVIDPTRRRELIDAVQAYFDLMYDCDTSRFDVVFSENAHLHGFRNGVMVSWSAPTYRGILDERRSPQSLGSPRLEEILMMDFASPTQAFVKVRVRIVDAVFVDYLTWHWISERWRVTSKGFQHEPHYPLGISDKLQDAAGASRTATPHVRHDTGIARQIGTYCDAVEIRSDARWLISAGTPGLSSDGRLASDIAGQAETAWTNVSDILLRAGMSLDDLVKVTSTLTRAEDIPAYSEVRSRVLGQRRPAFMLTVVPQLVRPEFLVEIEFVAAKT